MLCFQLAYDLHELIVFLLQIVLCLCCLFQLLRQLADTVLHLFYSSLVPLFVLVIQLLANLLPNLLLLELPQPMNLVGLLSQAVYSVFHVALVRVYFVRNLVKRCVQLAHM